MFLRLAREAGHPLLSREAFARLQKAPLMSSSDTLTSYTVSWLGYLQGLVLLGWNMADRWFVESWVNGLVPCLRAVGAHFVSFSRAGCSDDDALMRKFQPGLLTDSFEDFCYSRFQFSVHSTKGSSLPNIVPIRAISSVPALSAPGAPLSDLLPVDQLGTRGRPRVQVRNRYDADGRPLCNKCGSPDHLARECTARPAADAPVQQVLWDANTTYVGDQDPDGDQIFTLQEFALQQLEQLDFP